MARADAATVSPRADDGQARLMVAAATRLDDLADVVVAAVARTLPSNTGSVRIGTTSVAPRDEAARAARWVARLAAQQGLPATPVSPTSPRVTGWSIELPWGSSAEAVEGSPAHVGISRLDLTPVVAAVAQPYAVGVWLPLEPRARRLRRQLVSERDQSLIDAAVSARPVATVLVGRDHDMAIALVGVDLLAMDVMGRALRAAAQPVGDLGLSPWEAPVIQRGTELGAGVTHPDQISLESIWLGDPRAPGHERLHRIVEMASARAGIGRAAIASESARR